MPDDLEIVVKERIKPLLDRTTEKLIGVNIDKLTDDITSRMDKAGIFDINIDYSLRYSEAKKRFRKNYLTRLLLLNLGNISRAAKVAGMDRRSLHRIITASGINVNKIKKELHKPYNMKVDTMSHLIESVLDDYKQIIHPDKLQNIYSNVGVLSENIISELPELNFSMKEAEHEFEKLFFAHALEQANGSITMAARQIGLRYETLHRKMKALGMK